MKKRLFSLAMLSATFLALNAQEVLFDEDFETTTDFSEWVAYDEDGDGNGWLITKLVDENQVEVTSRILFSESWDKTGPLFPNNWIVTPEIDLTDYAGQNVVLNYDVMSINSDYDKEQYTVYVAESNDLKVLKNATITFNEETLDGVNELTPRSIDLSSLAGKKVYIAFRHHDASDQYAIQIDNIQVIAGNLAVGDQSLSTKSVIFPNPVKELLNIKLADGFKAADTKVTVTNLVGAEVASFKYNNVVNLSKIPAGVYIVTLSDGNKVENVKVVKK